MTAYEKIGACPRRSQINTDQAGFKENCVNTFGDIGPFVESYE